MICILKLDHRPVRDKRITTHCALVSRAFNAKKFYYSGIEDDSLKKNIIDVNKIWGSDFEVIYIKNPISFYKEFNGIKVHLTMYGEKIINKIESIKNKNLKKDILILIGGPKVDKSYYDLSNYNISVTNQPHSEVAALSLLLYFLNPDCLKKNNFKNNKIKITPSNKNKKVTNLK